MTFKITFAIALLATATLAQHQGGLQHYQSSHQQQHQPQIQYQQPQHHIQLQQPRYQSHHEPEHFDEHPKYEFSYKVEDEHTGDYKEQHETRDGDSVKGFYWLLDADGYRRLVEYSVDGHSGFVAKVTREPTGHAPVQPRPQVAHAAPIKVAPIQIAPVKLAVPIRAHAPIHAPAPIYAPAPIHAPAPIYAPAPIRAPAPIHASAPYQYHH